MSRARRIPKLFALLCALASPCSTLLAQSRQVAGVVAGSSAEFGSAAGDEKRVAALCLQKHILGMPDEGKPLRSLTGRVKVEFANGATEEMEIGDLTRRQLVAVEGDGPASSYVLLRKLDASVHSVTFIDDAALTQDAVHTDQIPRDAMARAVADLMRDAAGVPAADARQHFLQARPQLGLLEVSRGPDGVVERSLFADPTDLLKYKVFKTSVNGEITAIRTPAGECILKDGGGTEADFARAMEWCGSASPVMLTHLDRDHVIQFIDWLEKCPAGAFRASEVIVGYDPETIGQHTQGKRLCKLLEGHGYVLENDFKDFSRFVPVQRSSAGVRPIIRRIDDADSSGPARFELRLPSGFSMTLVRARDPRSISTRRHAFNLGVVVEHRGCAIVDLADASPELRREMYRNEADAAALNVRALERVRETYVKQWGELTERVARLKTAGQESSLECRELRTRATVLRRRIGALDNETDAATNDTEYFASDPALSRSRLTIPLENQFVVYKLPHHDELYPDTYERDLAEIEALSPGRLIISTGPRAKRVQDVIRRWGEGRADLERWGKPVPEAVVRDTKTTGDYELQVRRDGGEQRESAC